MIEFTCNILNINSFRFESKDDSIASLFFKSLFDGTINGVVSETTKQIVGYWKDQATMKSFLRTMEKNTKDFFNSIYDKKGNVLIESDVLQFQYDNEIKEHLYILLEKINYMITQPNENKLTNILTVLLAGVPGTGKTAIMKYITHLVFSKSQSNKKKCVIFFLSGSDLYSCSKKDGVSIISTLKNIIINYKRKGINVVLCIDEIDSLIGSNKDKKHAKIPLISAFINFLDSLDSIENNINNTEGDIFIIGTTNNPGCIEEAFSRRWKEYISFLLPTSDPKVATYKQYLSHLSSRTKITYNEISDLFLQFLASSESVLSYSDVNTIIFNAFLMCLITKQKSLTMKVLFKSFLETLRKTCEFQSESLIDIKKKEQNLINIFNKEFNLEENNNTDSDK